MPEKLKRVNIERACYFPKFDEIKPSFATLKLGDERLRAGKFLGEGCLAEARVLPGLYQEFSETVVLTSEDGTCHTML